MIEHELGDRQIRIAARRLLGTIRQDRAAQLFLKRLQLTDKTTGKTRPHALIKAFQLDRRTVGGNHHLTGTVDEAV